MYAVPVRRSYGGQLGDLDIVVGSDLNAFVGDHLSFYGVDCRVAAKLDKTGTSYDTAVFTNENTIKTLINSSVERGMNDFKVDPDSVVSCILINVDDEHTVEEVLNDINIHVRKVKAVQTKDMITGISDSLKGVSKMIGGLVAAVWVLGLIILLLAFTMSVNERKKEFAVLRVVGASQRKLSSIVLSEAVMTCLSGSFAGTVLGLIIIIPFNKFIEELLGLPFLLPAAWQIVLFFAAAIAEMLRELHTFFCTGIVSALSLEHGRLSLEGACTDDADQHYPKADKAGVCRHFVINERLHHAGYRRYFQRLENRLEEAQHDRCIKALSVLFTAEIKEVLQNLKHLPHRPLLKYEQSTSSCTDRPVRAAHHECPLPRYYRPL